jgi:biotin carboxyl carrier protein
MKRLKVTVEGKSYEVEVELLDEAYTSSPAPRRASSGGSRISAPVAKPVKAAPKAPAAAGSGGSVTSPLAALVVSIDVAIGDAVTEGQNLITLEAMKMNTMVAATAAGTVTAVHVKPGDGVDEGQSLITVE